MMCIPYRKMIRKERLLGFHPFDGTFLYVLKSKKTAKMQEFSWFPICVPKLIKYCSSCSSHLAELITCAVSHPLVLEIIQVDDASMIDLCKPFVSPIFFLFIWLQMYKTVQFDPKFNSIH